MDKLELDYSREVPLNSTYKIEIVLGNVSPNQSLNLGAFLLHLEKFGGVEIKTYEIEND